MFCAGRPVLGSVSPPCEFSLTFATDVRREEADDASRREAVRDGARGTRARQRAGHDRIVADVAERRNARRHRHRPVARVRQAVQTPLARQERVGCANSVVPPDPRHLQGNRVCEHYAIARIDSAVLSGERVPSRASWYSTRITPIRISLICRKPAAEFRSAADGRADPPWETHGRAKGGLMFKTIVWATDGSESADRALPLAKGLAQGDGRALVALHAKELLPGQRPCMPASTRSRRRSAVKSTKLALRDLMRPSSS